MKRIVADATPKVAGLGLQEGRQPIGFQVDALSGKITPLEKGGPANFVSSDNRQQLALMPNAITWATQQYVRWGQFKSQFDKVASYAIEQYETLVSISSVQLEYWDRFIWTGDWDDFDVAQLLKPSSPLISPKAVAARKEWHSHIGWFEDAEHSRRLWNVNVDVVGLAEATGVSRPSVGIYTMARDQMSAVRGQQDFFESKPVTSRLDLLHAELNEMFKGLICSDMCRRIGLETGG
ncbi:MULTISPECIES: TIGR04255 family protein [Rhodopseudomonas]|nr:MULTISPECIES: TIGR04255 family protein [Rhodopseudomonas]MDF3811052.1 TIGR04255 family protein [Rhodopseudomonas sp. BAL398]WOK15948.1 TIGR04255 family protein [Rhodopseudomonas sp. BAL398]